MARRDRSIAEISAWPRLNPIHFLPALISAWQTHKSAPIVITHPDTNIDGLYRSVDLHGSQFKERVILLYMAVMIFWIFCIKRPIEGSVNVWVEPTEKKSCEQEKSCVLEKKVANMIEMVLFLFFQTRGKSLLELWGTTFILDWQPPLIFVWFTSKSDEH